MSDTSIKATSDSGVIYMAQKAYKQKYNRQLSSKALKNLDPNGINVFKLMMIHEHAQGVPVAPHYRCWAYLKMEDRNDAVEIILDVPIKDFESWPTVEQVKEAQEKALKEQETANAG